MMHDVTVRVLIGRRIWLLGKRNLFQQGLDEAATAMKAAQKDLEFVAQQLTAIDQDLIAAGRDPERMTKDAIDA